MTRKSNGNAKSTAGAGEAADWAAPRPETEAFGTDPADAARAALVERVRELAAAPAAGRPVEALAREMTALHQLGCVTPDEAVRSDASDGATASLRMLSAIPAASAEDVALKLALVLRDSAKNELDGALPGPVARFALLAGALADLLMLRSGPIALPAEAAAPVIVPHAGGESRH